MSIFSAALRQPLIVFAVLLPAIFADAGYAEVKKFTVIYEQKKGSSLLDSHSITASMTEPDENGARYVSFESDPESGISEGSVQNYDAFTTNVDAESILDLYKQFSEEDYSILEQAQFIVPVVPSELLSPGGSGFTLNPYSVGQQHNDPDLTSGAGSSQSFFTGTLTAGAEDNAQQWNVEFYSTKQQNVIQLRQTLGETVATITILWQLASTSSDPTGANLPEEAAFGSGGSETEGEIDQTPVPSPLISEYSGGDEESAHQEEQEGNAVNSRKRLRRVSTLNPDKKIRLDFGGGF